jgi:hypothetical protein
MLFSNKNLNLFLSSEENFENADGYFSGSKKTRLSSSVDGQSSGDIDRSSSIAVWVLSTKKNKN